MLPNLKHLLVFKFCKANTLNSCGTPMPLQNCLLLHTEDVASMFFMELHDWDSCFLWSNLSSQATWYGQNQTHLQVTGQGLHVHPDFSLLHCCVFFCLFVFKQILNIWFYYIYFDLICIAWYILWTSPGSTMLNKMKYMHFLFLM